MARRTQTYAIRLAVEGGGQVKAPLDRHRRGHLPDGVAFSLSKLSRDRLQSVHPDLVRVVARAIQVTLP